MYIIKALGNNLSKQRPWSPPIARNRLPLISAHDLPPALLIPRVLCLMVGNAIRSVQVVVRWLLWPAAGSKVAHVNRLLHAAPFDAEEALVRVGLLVAAAHRLVLLGTHASTALEREGGQTALGGHHEDVLAAVLLAHVTVGLVELVVRSADEAPALLVALRFTVGGHHAVLQGHGHHPQATRLLLHLAHALVRVAIGSAHGRQLLLLGRTVKRALGVVLAESRTRTNMSQLHTTPGKGTERAKWRG